MEQNKTGKYFKYAIGEIILVMIGILLALQVNNWNENRIKSNKEIEILKDFQRELNADISEMNLIIPHYERAKKSITAILYHLENNSPYTDSMKYDFFNTTIVYDFGGLSNGIFETLKSVGFDLISNKEIRNTIIKVYDDNDPWLVSWSERYIDLIFEAEKNIYNTRFNDFWNGDYKDPKVIGSMIPLNYENLKNDKQYKYLLKTQLNLIGWLIGKPVEETTKESNKLLNMIQKELNK